MSALHLVQSTTGTPIVRRRRGLHRRPTRLHQMGQRWLASLETLLTWGLAPA